MGKSQMLDDASRSTFTRSDYATRVIQRDFARDVERD